MILYNIGEVTDRTIHFFFSITLRGRRTTHAYSLLSSSLIHIRNHTHAHIRTHIFKHTLVFIYYWALLIIPFILLQSLSHFHLAFSRIDKVRPSILFFIIFLVILDSLSTDISHSFHTSSIRLTINSRSN